jgi:glycosyltransferase involved in cell wall biosynthesis
MNQENPPIVSLIVIARNAALHLPSLLSDIALQDYPKNKTDLLLADGLSADDSKKLMLAFAESHSDLAITVLDNPGRFLSSGWNIALAHSKGEIIIRVDVHSRIPSDFISKNVSRIISGESIAGGPVIAKENGDLWPGLLALAEKSRFGGSVADFRNPGNPRYVDTLAYAAYRREIFQKAGGFDERLVRHQDNEMHYRMKQLGYRFFFDPAIKSYYIPRSQLFSVLKHRFDVGLWIGIAAGIQPRCFGLRHFIPAVFVAAVMLCLSIGPVLNWLPVLALVSFYFLGAIIFALQAMIIAHLKLKLFCMMLPIIFLLMHLSYGIGTWIGLMKMPFYINVHRRYAVPRPVK